MGTDHGPWWFLIIGGIAVGLISWAIWGINHNPDSSEPTTQGTP